MEASTDEAGARTRTLAHDPFGERRKADWTAAMPPGAALGVPTRGHTHRRGFIHRNGRVYDPALGRFLSPDPLVGNPGSAQAWNGYRYVSNSPMSFVDPSGLSQAPGAGGCDLVGVTCGAAGGGFGVASVVSTHRFLYVDIFISFVSSWFNRPTEPWINYGEGGGGADGGWEDYDAFYHFVYWEASVRVTGHVPVFVTPNIPGEDITADGIELKAWYENLILPGKHSYLYLSPAICQVSSNCTLERIIKSVNERGVHPNQTRTFVPGEDYVDDVDLPGPWFDDDVATTAVYNEKGVQIGIQNDTLNNHLLDSGTVRRTVIRIGSKYHILTEGEGDGWLGGLNILGYKAEWRDVNQRVLDDFR